MINKVIIGKSFYDACKYVCMDKKRAIILENEGVRSYDYKLMAKDFEWQHAMRPVLNRAVFHGIMSFYPGEKMNDATMVEIAKKYLLEMKIINTQYAIVKHIDKKHAHLHIIANLVNNNLEAITDSWIGLRSKKTAQKLTIKYGLRQAITKNLLLTNMDALNKEDTNRYFIYKAIEEKLPSCRNLDDLKEKLAKENIETLYAYKKGSSELQGISFKIGDYKYKGSKIDRKFSLNNLRNIIYRHRIEGLLESPANASYANLLSKESPSILQNVNNGNKNLFDLLIREGQIDDPSPYWKLDINAKLKRANGVHL